MRWARGVEEVRNVTSGGGGGRGLVGVDPLEQARHPEVPHGVLEAAAADVAAELLGVLLHPRAPVVLDLVVGAAGQVLRDLGPAVAPARVQLQDEQLLLRRDAAAPEVRAQVVEPPQAAALARPAKPCSKESSSVQLQFALVACRLTRWTCS